jgi:hypothetical protein
LRTAAIARIHHAPAVLGPVRIELMPDIAPVYRPLISRLCSIVPVEWVGACATDKVWFPGTVASIDYSDPLPAPEVVSCADPHSEVVEALRWARELMASGRVSASEIAIAASSPEAWDEHVLALATDAGLPIHFSHGVPALSTREGQRCAALADVLLNGLSQSRCQRLFRLIAGDGSQLDSVPADWMRELPSNAALRTADQWQLALDRLAVARPELDPLPGVMPIITVLAGGPAQAEDAGALLMRGVAARLWAEALRAAPAEALELSLQELRVSDAKDPGNSVVWSPASHLVGAPRPWTRLLGMTNRSWPRQVTEDPLLPNHILDPRTLNPVSIPDRDRSAFEIIRDAARRSFVLSYSRRDAKGRLLARSPVLPHAVPERRLGRARIPQHAFSEADRLVARPDEAQNLPRLISATSCWRDWRRGTITPHDGRVRPDHPVIVRALSGVQSARSLGRVIRDPLGFVWRYAFGWRSTIKEEGLLELDARAFGELVHELLRRVVKALEPDPGFSRATPGQIEAALDEAADIIIREWPVERSVPPTLLWRHTVDEARCQALGGLTSFPNLEPGTRSWTELPFGQVPFLEPATELPWDPCVPVEIPGIGVRIRGIIDRLDLRQDGDAVRITDFKTGKVPRRPDRIVLRGGVELQRVIYAAAARQLLPNVRRIISRLVYLAEGPREFRLPNIDQAIEQSSEMLRACCGSIRNGNAYPGPDAREPIHEFRLALPANASNGYFRTKQASLARDLEHISCFWGLV